MDDKNTNNIPENLLGLETIRKFLVLGPNSTRVMNQSPAINLSLVIRRVIRILLSGFTFTFIRLCVFEFVFFSLLTFLWFYLVILFSRVLKNGKRGIEVTCSIRVG